MSSPETKQLRQRVLFHGDDTGGAEQSWRLLALAGRLGRLRPDLAIVVVAGLMPVDVGTLPENVDWIELPTSVIRGRLVDDVCERFSPGLLIVDGSPAQGPLLDSIRCLRGGADGRQVWLSIGSCNDAAAGDVADGANGPSPSVEDYVYDNVIVLGSGDAEEVVERAAWALSAAVPPAD